MPAGLPSEGFGLSTLPQYQPQNPQFFVNDPNRALASLNLGVDTVGNLATFTEGIAAANAQNRLKAQRSLADLDLIDQQIATEKATLDAQMADAKLRQAQATGEVDLEPLRLDSQRKRLAAVSSAAQLQRLEMEDDLQQREHYVREMMQGRIPQDLQGLMTPGQGAPGVSLAPPIQGQPMITQGTATLEMPGATETLTDATASAPRGTLGNLPIPETYRQYVDRSSPRAMLDLDLGAERLARAKLDTAAAGLDLDVARELGAEGRPQAGRFQPREVGLDPITGEGIWMVFDSAKGTERELRVPKALKDQGWNFAGIVKNKDGTDVVLYSRVNRDGDVETRTSEDSFRKTTAPPSTSRSGSRVGNVPLPVRGQGGTPSVTPQQQAVTNATGGTLNAAQNAQSAGQAAANKPRYGRRPDGTYGLLP